MFGVTVIDVMAFLPLDGVKVLPADDVSVAVRVSPFNSVTVPVTPRIDTPDLILLALISLSMLAVTAATLTGLYPSVPLGAVMTCADVVGVTVNDVITGALPPLGIVAISVASWLEPPPLVTVPPLLVIAVLAF